MAAIKEFFAKMWAEQRGATLGVIIGVSLAAIILSFGFWQSVLLVLCGWIGFVIGARADSREDLKRMMNHVFGDKEE